MRAPHRVVNLTPHEVRILVGDAVASIPPSGEVARVGMVAVEAEPVPGMPLVPVRVSEPGRVEGLPERRDGVTFIVSRVVAAAVPERADLVYPDDLVRDDAGRVTGCRAFGRAAPSRHEGAV